MGNIIAPHSHEQTKQNFKRAQQIIADIISAELAFDLYTKEQLKLIRAEEHQLSIKKQYTYSEIRVEKPEQLPQAHTSQSNLLANKREEFYDALKALNSALADNLSTAYQVTSEKIDKLVENKKIDEPIAKDMKEAFKKTFSLETAKEVLHSVFASPINENAVCVPAPKPSLTESKKAKEEEVAQKFENNFNRNMEEIRNRRNAVRIPDAMKYVVEEVSRDQSAHVAGILLATLAMRRNIFASILNFPKEGSLGKNEFAFFQFEAMVLTSENDLLAASARSSNNKK